MRKRTKAIFAIILAAIAIAATAIPAFAYGTWECTECGNWFNGDFMSCSTCNSDANMIYRCDNCGETGYGYYGLDECEYCGVSLTDEATIRYYTQAEVDAILRDYIKKTEHERLLQEAIDTEYQAGYDQGKLDVWDEAYWEGYDQGQMDGAVCTGHVTEEEAARREAEAYSRGIDKGEANNVTGNFRSLLGDIVTAPYRAVTTMFDFEIFGVNLAGLVFKLITVLVTVLIVSKLFGLIF